MLSPAPSQLFPSLLLALLNYHPQPMKKLVHIDLRLHLSWLQGPDACISCFMDYPVVALDCFQTRHSQISVVHTQPHACALAGADTRPVPCVTPSINSSTLYLLLLQQLDSNLFHQQASATAQQLLEGVQARVDQSVHSIPKHQEVITCQKQ